jgi:hypothetical protein
LERAILQEDVDQLASLEIPEEWIKEPNAEVFRSTCNANLKLLKSMKVHEASHRILHFQREISRRENCQSQEGFVNSMRNVTI